MDHFADRHPYRCLPLTMANTTGWEILCPVGFTASWDGGAHQNCITFRADHPYPGFDDFVKSHFSRGTITFHTGYLFRTPPGWSIWTMGPPNHIKDGVQPLAGLVETDWLPFPFTMNWIFTRPGTVRFEKGEPFCFFMMIQDKPLEQVQPVIRSMNSNPDLRGQYDAWGRQARRVQRPDLQARARSDEGGVAALLLQGRISRGGRGPRPAAHVNKRRLKAPKIG
jgi:hypothetical protein